MNSKWILFTAGMVGDYSDLSTLYIYTYIYILYIANQSNYRKCLVDLIHISNLKPLGPSSFFFQGPVYFQSHLTFGEVYVIATKQNIFLQNSWVTTFLGIFGL